jgi:hypothetical protein
MTVILPRCSLAASLLLGVLLAGCTLTQKEDSDAVVSQWPNGEEPPPQAEKSQPEGPTYTVEIRRPGYTTQFNRIQHQGPTHLQNALEKSGATSKMKRMELYVLRAPPQGGPRQRLAAVFDGAEGRVKWESDYAIYPGDHVVAIEDTSSEFDDMMSRLLGPFGAK